MTTATIRLLALTGCRRGEILSLKWTFYREGNLYLPDGKTGPRTAWLSSPARAVLDDLPRTSRWVFPAARGNGHLSEGAVGSIWRPLRAEIGLEDVRLHDLRHGYASIAAARGETVLAIGRLLGHRKASTTLRYTHFSDAMVREAADAVAATLEP